MPTIMWVGRYAIAIRTHDHGRVGDFDNPAHVHVLARGVDVKISIGDVGVRPRILRVVGVSDQDVVWFKEIVEANQGWLITKWREIHGQ